MKWFYYLRNITLLIFFTGIQSYAQGQSDPEFPKGFILYAKLHSGMVTNFTNYPDLYTGGIQLAPQVTVVPHLLRVGAIAGVFYTNKRLDGEFGPSVSIKLKTFNADLQGAQVGSLGNINLLINHLWGTGKQRLLGGGVILDMGNLITLGITCQRDYKLDTWWFQAEIGIRISKKKKNPEI